MVDLVKIRKKAKKQIPSESEGPGRAEGPQPEVEAVPVAEVEKPAAAQPPSSLADARDNAPAPSSLADARDEKTKLDRFKEDAGKKREGFVHAEEIVESAEQFELLTFVISGEHYALDIERIVEIVTPREITRVPNADESIVGIISLRGTIVTLIDVRKRLQHPQAGAADADTRTVVVQFTDEMVGFQVDRVLRVIKVDRNAIEPHPVVHVSEQSEAIRGVFHHANALTILLDFDKLLGARHGTHV
jgi:purine-binding chemotaxis protein CheW